MYDRELVCSILTQISDALETIQTRCKDVKSVSFFTDSPQGMEKRDSVCMLLMAVGESVKNLDKLTDGQLFAAYPTIDWTGIKGFRDIVAHHYFDIDAEQVYWIISRELKPLSEIINQMICDQA